MWQDDVQQGSRAKIAKLDIAWIWASPGDPQRTLSWGPVLSPFWGKAGHGHTQNRQ